MNKFLAVVIALFLLLGLIGLFIRDESILSNYAEVSFVIAENIGIIMMLVNGTFISTQYFKISTGLILIIVLGALMKILHLTGADETLLFPFPVLLLVYLIHFIYKKPKKHLDVLKLLTLTIFLILPPLSILHFIPEKTKETLLLISHIVFWFTFLDFISLVTLKKLCSKNN
jgi:hypothetical protein